jgi:serine/threonine-protein kinase
VIKTISRVFAEDEAARLIAEGELAAAFRHPNTCVISDKGELPDGRPYLVMERLIGQTLRDRLLEGAIDIGPAIDVITQVLSVLAIAHQAGVVHRDIKPANIFLATVLGRPPLVKVLDFGVAKIPDRAITRSGALVGTPAYMAPEQVQGDAVDGRTDVYAAAAVLYEMIAGVRPFKSEGARATLIAITKGAAPKLAEIRPAVSRSLSDVIARGMHVDRAQRWPSAVDFLEQLARVRSPAEAWNYPTQPHPVAPLEAEEEQTRRND